jgi:hypothetical protein
MKHIATLCEDGNLKSSNKSQLDTGKAFDLSFIDELNEYAKTLSWKSAYINELFMFFFIKIKSYEKTFVLNGITDLHAGTNTKLPWELFSAAKLTNLSISHWVVWKHYIINILLLLSSITIVLITSLVFPAIALLKFTNKQAKALTGFAIIRSPASLSKLKYLEKEGEATFYFDDLFTLKSENVSMYAIVSFKYKLCSLFVIPFKSVIDFYILTKDSLRLFGLMQIGYVQYHYALKIAHKCLYEFYLSKIMYERQSYTFYTAHKEDRFAVIDINLCKKYNINSICIPHGVEYSFYVPTGLPGDVFFCTTKNAEKHLNRLYQSNKFQFNEQIAMGMFAVDKIKECDSKLVFFTEALGTSVNIEIIKSLIDYGAPFYVKLHPKDRESNYKELFNEFEFIKDFNSSITNNICLARKSTVLVEALYNHSTSIAVVTDLFDKAYVDCMIPSLLDKRIHQITSFSDLDEILNTLKVKM